MKRKTFSVLVLALLSACGGGGGNDSPTSSSPSVPVQAAFKNIYVGPVTFSATVTSSQNGQRTPYTSTRTPGGNTTFQGSLRQTATITSSGSAPRVIYYSLNPLVLYGESDASSVIPYTEYIAPPATARPGDSGPLYNGRRSSTTGAQGVGGTINANWRVAARDATSSFACLDYVVVVPSGSSRNEVSGQGSDCYAVDGAGNTLGPVLFTFTATTGATIVAQ